MFFFARGSSFTVDQWVAFFSRDPARCSHSVKRFCKTPCANQLVQKDKTKASGLDFAFQCSLCEYSCDTDQKLSLHNFSKHRVMDPIRCYVNTTFCTVCLVEFHQRERERSKPHPERENPMQATAPACWAPHLC